MTELADVRLALTSLAVHTTPQPADLITELTDNHGFESMAVKEALELLRRATVNRDRHVPRLVVFEVLLKLHRGEAGIDMTEHRESVIELLTALAVEADNDEDLARHVAEHSYAAIQLAVEEADREAEWHTFHTLTSSAYKFTSDEIHKPICNDAQIVDTAHGPARVLEVSFHTDRPPHDFAAWCDPINWPSCSAYFTAMQPIGPIQQGPKPGSWTRDFMEHVELFAGLTLVTPLRFSYEQTPGTSVRVTYDLVATTTDIVVDNGYIWAQHDPTAPADASTKVTAVKVVKFTDATLDSWPSLACDTFWTELVIDTAVDCASGDKKAPIGSSKPKSGGSGADACDEPIKATADQWKQWVDAWAKAATDTAKAAHGGAPLDPAKNADSLMTTWSQAWVNAVELWSTWTGAAQQTYQKAQKPEGGSGS